MALLFHPKRRTKQKKETGSTPFPGIALRTDEQVSAAVSTGHQFPGINNNLTSGSTSKYMYTNNTGNIVASATAPSILATSDGASSSSSSNTSNNSNSTSNPLNNNNTNNNSSSSSSSSPTTSSLSQQSVQYTSTTSMSNSNNTTTTTSSTITPVDEWNVHIVAVESNRASLCGHRPQMEDMDITVDYLAETRAELAASHYQDNEWARNISFWGVFDGHGGYKASTCCVNQVLQEIMHDEHWKQRNVEAAIRHGMLTCDQKIVEQANRENWKDGSTGCLALLVDDYLYVGNLGDSEIVLGKRRVPRKNSLTLSTAPRQDLTRATREHPEWLDVQLSCDLPGHEAVLLTELHSPDIPEEKKRIEEAGGVVIKGRLFSDLAVSRAFGDAQYKTPKAEANYISSEPYVTRIPLDMTDEFIILASDGLWDVFKYQEAVDFVSDYLEKKTISGRPVALGPLPPGERGDDEIYSEGLLVNSSSSCSSSSASTSASTLPDLPVSETSTLTLVSEGFTPSETSLTANDNSASPPISSSSNSIELPSTTSTTDESSSSSSSTTTTSESTSSPTTNSETNQESTTSSTVQTISAEGNPSESSSTTSSSTTESADPSSSSSSSSSSTTTTTESTPAPAPTKNIRSLAALRNMGMGGGDSSSASESSEGSDAPSKNPRSLGALRSLGAAGGKPSASSAAQKMNEIRSKKQKFKGAITADMLQNALSKKTNVAALLANEAIRRGSRDNTTVIVVFFQWEEDIDDLSSDSDD